MLMDQSLLTERLARPRAASRSGMSLIWLIALLIAVALGAVGAALARQGQPAYRIDLGVEQLDGAYNLIGFYALERNASFAYRWTAPSTLLQLPWAYQAAPRYSANLRLRDPDPAGQRELTILANEQALATLQPGDQFRTYRLLLPPAAPAEPHLRLALRTSPFSASGDTRPLGIIITAIGLAPLPNTDWPTLLVLVGGVGLLWAGLRLRGTPNLAATLTGGLIGLGLAAMLARYRPAPLPFSILASLALGSVGLACALVRPLAARLGLAALCLLVSFASVIWPAWLSDDAFISFRYAQNLAQGHGLVYNLGERVEGYTNFLWTVIAAGVIRAGGDIVGFAYLAGVLIGVALVLATYRLTASLLSTQYPTPNIQHPSAWALVAALVVATHQGLLLYTARGAGLETGFFALLVLLGVSAYLHTQAAPQRGRGLASVGLLFALASMTRPEGVLVMAVTGLHYLIANGRLQIAARGRISLLALISNLPWLVGPYLLIFVPYFIWRLSYYGDLLPNTFYAKTGGGLQQVLRGLQYAGGFALSLGGPLLLIIFAPLLGGWRALLSGWRGYLLLLVGAYSSYIVVVGGDHFRGERFFVPLVPLFAILMADGLREIYGKFNHEEHEGHEGRTNKTVAPFVVNLTLALLLTGGSVAALSRTAPYDYIIRGLDESVWIWREIGWWMADNTPPDASIAATGAGAIAFYGERTTIDLYGLTDKHIARVAVSDMGSGVAGHEKRDPAYVINERQPTYIPQMWDDYFGGAEALRGRYRLITITTRFGRELGMWELLP